MKRKTAFVTGASRGIGAESAVALARNGYDVVITARTAVEGEQHDHVGSVTAMPGSLEATASAIRREASAAMIGRRREGVLRRGRSEENER